VCGEESPEDFVSCPNCQAWNSEIDRTGVRLCYLLGIGIALLLLSLSSALPGLIRMILVVAFSASMIAAVATAVKLKRMQRGQAP